MNIKMAMLEKSKWCHALFKEVNLHPGMVLFELKLLLQGRSFICLSGSSAVFFTMFINMSVVSIYVKAE